MTVYLLLKFLHVVLAIVAVGANVTYGIWLGLAARDPRHLPFALRGVKVLDDRVANPAYILLLVTGVLMAVMGKISLATPWLSMSLALYAVLTVVGLAGYTPTLRRQISALGASGPDGPEYRALASRGQRLGVVLAVLVMAIVYLMVAKPALWRAATP